VEKSKIFASAGIRPRFLGRLARSLVTTPTELSPLISSSKCNQKQGCCSAYMSTMKMEVARSSETSVNFYQTASHPRKQHSSKYIFFFFFNRTRMVWNFLAGSATISFPGTLIYCGVMSQHSPRETEENGGIYQLE
jgi:hypothetical protein